ncbi:oligosaccharide flippase family protein [Candidatus Parcubacteria bacterium]|nr:oligosaccharide flippase family protein [Candidatus Parcubacteria bacterium]
MTSLKDKVYSLLRRSEGVFKTDMVYLAKGGFWITFGQVFSNILSLGLLIAFANFLPKETYGLYRYILSLASVLNVFTLTGMNNAVARSVASGDEGALRSSVRYQLKWNVIMLLAFWTLSGYYFLHHDQLFSASFFILGLFVPATLAFNTYGSYLEGKKDFRSASIFNILSTFIYVLGAFAALFIKGEVIWLILAYALTTFFTTYVFYKITLRRFHPPLHTSGEAITYGRELTFIGFVDPIASQLDKILLTHFWGPAQLAVYALAMAVPERAISLIKNWVGLGFPNFASKTAKELNHLFYTRIIQGLIVGILCFGMYMLLAPYLFAYLLPKYLDALPYSKILALSFIFAIPNRYVSLLLVSQKFSKTIFINSIIQNVIKISLYLILGISGGITGLVLAFVLVNLLGMIANITIWKVRTRNSASLA